MNHKQIDRLVGSVPTTIAGGQRKRLEGYAAAAHRCESRISTLRVDLEQALRGIGDTVDLDASADRALALLMELDSLERVQPRIDAWLRVSAGALADNQPTGPVGEGPI